jgi:hypothetical protein
VLAGEHFEPFEATTIPNMNPGVSPAFTTTLL